MKCGMRTDVTKEAIGRWPSILAAIGVQEEFLRNKHGPCPVCGGKDRYRFDDRGKGMWLCNKCGSGDGFSLIKMLRNVDFRAAAQLVRDVLPSSTVTVAKKERNVEKMRERMNRIWTAAKPLAYGDYVVAYLIRRGIKIDRYPADLRCGRVDYWDEGKKLGEYPAMIAMVRDASGKPATLHVTYLKAGQKAPVRAPKKVLSSMPPGSAIRLCEIQEGRIAVAEGIETALAFERPCWACISEGGLRKWTPPAGVREVTVAGDNDASFVGQAAAYDLAKRLHAQGIKVVVRIPDVVGMDWADERVAS